MAVTEAPSIVLARPRRARSISALGTLVRRRAALTAGNPRQIAVPLLGPALIALIVAPALKAATGGLHSAIDYQSFAGVGAVGLVIPLSCIFAGLSVIVDRHSGAQRELLAAPVPRSYLVLGNLIVAVVLSALQAVVLVGLTALRGGAFHISSTGIDWALAAGLLFTVFMYGVAETLAAGSASPGVRRRGPRRRDPSVLLRRSPISDQRDAGRTDHNRQVPAADTYAGAAALRTRRPARARPTRHLGAGNPTIEAFASLAVIALYAAR